MGRPGVHQPSHRYLTSHAAVGRSVVRSLRSLYCVRPQLMLNVSQHQTPVAFSREVVARGTI